MELNYERTYQIELINEFSAGVYNRVLNYALTHNLDTQNTKILEVNLLKQLEVAQEVNLFQQTLEELKAIDDYWESMDKYSKKILSK